MRMFILITALSLTGCLQSEGAKLGKQWCKQNGGDDFPRRMMNGQISLEIPQQLMKEVLEAGKTGLMSEMQAVNKKGDDFKQYVFSNCPETAAILPF